MKKATILTTTVGDIRQGKNTTIEIEVDCYYSSDNWMVHSPPLELQKNMNDHIYLVSHKSGKALAHYEHVNLAISACDMLEEIAPEGFTEGINKTFRAHIDDILEITDGTPYGKMRRQRIYGIITGNTAKQKARPICERTRLEKTWIVLNYSTGVIVAQKDYEGNKG